MAARILIAEDDPANMELARYLLARAGYQLLLATDGAMGAQLALEGNPDLILCDVQLPVMNGYFIAKKLRSNPDWRRVPLVAFTALSMPGDKEKILAAGFDAYLPKPITPETFVREVEAFLPQSLRLSR